MKTTKNIKMGANEYGLNDLKTDLSNITLLINEAFEEETSDTKTVKELCAVQDLLDVVYCFLDENVDFYSKP